MKRILIIDDEAALRANLRDGFVFENFNIIEAQNGLEGVRLAQELLPDLIICDIAMPELDGYGVLTKLRADPRTRSIPVILLTARAETAAARHGGELGADSYITKPFTWHELLAVTRAHLGN